MADEISASASDESFLFQLAGWPGLFISLARINSEGVPILAFFARVGIVEACSESF
jgi:hypothetical protein